MTFSTLDGAGSGAKLHYRIDGPDGAPWLTLSNSLGTDLTMWSAQIDALTQHFRVLRYDTRGHGQSEVAPGPYTIAQLAGDVIGLFDTLGIARSHFCGISMGGLTGLALGARFPERIDRLVLSNTAAKIGSPEAWQTRIDAVRAQGMAGFADPVLERWFTTSFRLANPEKMQTLRTVFSATSVDGYAANCAALAAADLRAEAANVKAPTLVITGTHDQSTSAEQGRWLQQAIPGAQYLELDAGHIANIEQAERYTRALLRFLRSGAVTEKERYDAGMEVRRAVLGDTHVDRSLTRITDFNSEFQNLITRYAWGDIWTRDGLPRHTRSLLTIAMMVALNRNEELALHFRAAKNNGVNRDQIKEVLLQCAIYCGVPAANSAFHLAEKVWEEEAAQGAGGPH